MVSDLKPDLVMASTQRRPNVHLMGNPAAMAGEARGDGIRAAEELGVVRDALLRAHLT